MARNRLRQQALETLIFLARAFHSGKWQRLTQNWPSANDNSVTKVKERFEEEEEEVEAAKSVSCSFDLCLVKRSRGSNSNEDILRSLESRRGDKKCITLASA